MNKVSCASDNKILLLSLYIYIYIYIYKLETDYQILYGDLDLF